MENFFIRSVVRTPIRDKFLWSSGYVVRNKCIYSDDVLLHALSFSPTYFLVFERGFLLFDHANLFVLDKLNGEEFVGTFESNPLLVSSSIEESLILIVLKGKCLLLNSYFELVGTLETSSDVHSVEWNPHAHLIYCATEHSLLILSTQLELLKDVCYSGPIALRSANLLAVVCNGRVHFIERNGLEFGSPLVLSEPDVSTRTGEMPASVVSHVKFLDRNTLITLSNHLTLYNSRNSKWYKKLQHEIKGRFLGLIKNTLYFECDGIISIKIFKEFTKGDGMFFVVDGNSLFFYDYRKSIVPPPFYNRVLELPDNIKNVSVCCNKIAVLMSSHSGRHTCKLKSHHLTENNFNSEKVACSVDDGDCAASLKIYNIEDFAQEHSIDVPSFQEDILEILLLEKAVWIRLETHMCSVDINTSKVHARVEVSGILRMYFFDRVVLLDAKRRLHILDEKHRIHNHLSLDDRCIETDDDLVYYDMHVRKGTYFVQFNSQLFCDGLLIDGVVSFLVHKNLLIVTKHDSIQFTSLENILLRRESTKCETRGLEAYVLDDSSSQGRNNNIGKAHAEGASLRRITICSETLVAERNSVILAYTSLMILYVPRGNIEAFSLRPVIVESVKEQIQSRKYKEALSACAANCISFDIWIGMEMDISKIAASVSQSHIIMLFTELLSLLELGNVDTSSVLQFIAAKEVAIKIENIRLNGGHSNPVLSKCHVAGHEEACVVTLHRNADPLSVLECLLHVLSNSILVKILIRVGVFPVALAISDSLEDTVKASVCHTTPDNLIKQSLLLFDVEMSSRIALILDRRDYLYEIQQMKGGDEKFKIFDYLKMHERALDRLLERPLSGNKQSDIKCCGLAQVSEAHDTCKNSSRIVEDAGLASALAYVEEHDLYEYSMRYNHPKFIEAYAEKLFRCRNYEKSFSLYKKIDLEKALEVSFFLESRCSIDVASQLNILDTGFYRKLVKSLVQRGRWEEAAHMQRDILKENAMSYFLCSNNMLESLVEFAKHVWTHRRNKKCMCPEKDVFIGLDQQAKHESVPGLLSTYGHVLFDSECIKKDPYYKEFTAKIKEIELSENNVLDRKAHQVERCMQLVRSIKGESCGASDTTFSYTVSGKSVKMSEEEFVQKRLSVLKKEVSSLKTNEIADILESMGVVSDLRSKYSNVVRNIQDIADMAALLV